MGNAEYSAKVVEATRELTGKERVAIKMFTDAYQLDEITQNYEDGVLINVDYVAKVAVHNEKVTTKTTTNIFM